MITLAVVLILLCLFPQAIRLFSWFGWAMLALMGGVWVLVVCFG